VGRFLLATSRPEAIASFLWLEADDRMAEVRIVQVELNGEPGILMRAHGRPIAAMVLEVGEGQVQTIHLVANPAKLGGLGKVRAPHAENS
jgi:hypothetical protein